MKAMVALSLAVVLTTSGAHAQGPSGDLGAAQALFDRAVELMGQDAFDEACPKLEEVVRLVPEGLGAKLRLAECYERGGKLASAWTTYVLAEQSALRDGQTTRAGQARERADAIAPRLRRLRIDVAAAARALPELVVRRDGRVVRAPEWGVGVAVDPGKHLVEAEAPGHDAWSRTIEIAAEDVNVEVPALVRRAAAPPAPHPPPLAPAATPQPTTRPTPPPPAELETRVPAWAWVSGGAGIALGAVAIGFLADQLSVQSDIDRNCSADVCEPGFDSASANDRLYRDNGFAIGFGAASLVGIGAAVVGIATAPKVSVAVARESVDLTWGGVF